VRRRHEHQEVPEGLDLDEAVWWMVAAGATLDELNAYVDEHGPVVPDPRPS
jgi:hypothetical protein